MANDELIGEMPTTGAMRPGPVGLSSAPAALSAATGGVRPVAIRIVKIGVDTEVERRPIIDGVMQDPTGPWVVGWYGLTSRHGVPGNAVLAGHVDFAGVGPAVLARAAELHARDLIELTGADVRVYRYTVLWNRLYDIADAPIAEIIGPTKRESMILITCGGPFDSARQEYLQRHLIRAERTA